MSSSFHPLRSSNTLSCLLLFFFYLCSERLAHRKCGRRSFRTSSNSLRSEMSWRSSNRQQQTPRSQPCATASDDSEELEEDEGRGRGREGLLPVKIPLDGNEFFLTFLLYTPSSWFLLPFRKVTLDFLASPSCLRRRLPTPSSPPANLLSPFTISNLSQPSLSSAPLPC